MPFSDTITGHLPNRIATTDEPWARQYLELVKFAGSFDRTGCPQAAHLLRKSSAHLADWLGEWPQWPDSYKPVVHTKAYEAIKEAMESADLGAAVEPLPPYPI